MVKFLGSWLFILINIFKKKKINLVFSVYVFKLNIIDIDNGLHKRTEVDFLGLLICQSITDPYSDL